MEQKKHKVRSQLLSKYGIDVSTDSEIFPVYRLQYEAIKTQKTLIGLVVFLSVLVMAMVGVLLKTPTPPIEKHASTPAFFTKTKKTKIGNTKMEVAILDIALSDTNFTLGNAVFVNVDSTGVQKIILPLKKLN